MDQVEAFGQVETRVQRGARVEDLMPFACDLCQQVLPDPAWAQVRAIDWTASSDQADSGLLRPATSDSYIQGSATYPDKEWLFDDAWHPAARYAHSEAQDRIYRIASEQVGGEVLPIADYVVTFVHAAGTVNTLIDRVDRKMWLGPVTERGSAVGHDSGDAIYLGELGREGIDRTGAGWI